MKTVDAIDLITAKARETCPDWIMDADNEQVVTSIAAWLAREPRQNIDLNKGILLVGNVGTGKSLLLRAVREAMRDAYGTQFGMRTCAEMVRSYSDQGYDDLERWMIAPHVCFDDLGAEGEAIHYGKRTNIMAEVIEARYDRMGSGKKCWTHLSTNLGTDQIQERYGARVASRLRHMCNLLDLGASAKARDRRADAPGPNRLEPVNADNLYMVVHPKIAERLQAALAPAIEAARALQEERKPPPLRGTYTAEGDRAAFADAVKQKSDFELYATRESFVKSYPVTNLGHEEAMRYVAMIDAELENRKLKVA